MIQRLNEILTNIHEEFLKHLQSCAFFILSSTYIRSIAKIDGKMAASLYRCPKFLITPGILFLLQIIQWSTVVIYGEGLPSLHFPISIHQKRHCFIVDKLYSTLQSHFSQKKYCKTLTALPWKVLRRNAYFSSTSSNIHGSILQILQRFTSFSFVFNW